MFESLKPSNKSCTRILTLRNAIHDICFQFRYISCTHFLQLSFLFVCNTQHAFFITSQPPETKNFTFRSTRNRITMAESEDCFLLLLQPASNNSTHTHKKFKILSNFSLTRMKLNINWKIFVDCFCVHLLNVICVLKSAESIFMRCHKSKQITKR